MEQKKNKIHGSRFWIDESVFQNEDSVLVFDKPIHCTSFDLVAKVKRSMRRRVGSKVKVGHAGTLDPLASGVMIVCTGKFTKQIDSFQAQEKEYVGTIRIGETTPSYDMEKPVDATYPYDHVTEEMVRAVAQQMTGEQEQVPPQYSAIRVAGRRAFDYAREGSDVEIKPRKITISTFEITRCELPEVDFRIVCSKGTYIRSIARDFGMLLESGAHLTALRRTRVGEFTLDHAIPCKMVDEQTPSSEQSRSYLAMGMMSGTSLDGLDMVLCRFHCDDGQWRYRVLKSRTVHYDKRLRERLATADMMSGLQLMQLDHDLGCYMAEAANRFLRKSVATPLLIASHGHTIFHQPIQGFTTQIGSGAVIAAHTALPVVCDFRSVDVALQGQGAPLVPIGDQYLFAQYDACLNLGGFCNISFDDEARRVAFDIAPCNMLLNHLATRIHLFYDAYGAEARKGELLPSLLSKMNGLEFYQQSGVKSLGKEWFDAEIMPLLSPYKDAINDLLRTAVEHIAVQIAAVINAHKIQSLLITGGGAKNTFLIERVKALCPNTQCIIPNEVVVDFKEAIIFAFLGILRWENIPNCLQSVTGATHDNCGGAIYMPALPLHDHLASE